MVDEDKVAAFRAFDFDSSAEFQAHLRNIELPGGSAAAAALMKVKAKWFARNVDPGFNPADVAAPPAQQQQQQPGSQPVRPPPAAAQSRAPPAGRTPVAQRNVALLSVAVLFLALLALQPLSPRTSAAAYRQLLLTLLALQATKLLAAVGLPAGLNVQAAAAWLQRAQPCGDFHYLLLALAGAISPPTTALLTPFVVRAAYDLGAHLADHHGGLLEGPWRAHGAPAWAWMQRNRQLALQLVAQSEVMLGLMLLVTLPLPARKPALTLFVWQFLRMRFWSADAALQHRQVWAALGQFTLGVRQRYPLLQKPVDFGVRYFHGGARTNR